MKKVLFVCTGNICRSPSAEAVLKHMAAEESRISDFEIDSAGTHGYHVGELSDERAIKHARLRGVDMIGIKARKVEVADFDLFDLIIAMDEGHLTQLLQLQPVRSKAEVRLFTDFMTAPQVKDVPDPYYGGADGFDVVLDMLEEGCCGLLKEI